MKKLFILIPLYLIAMASTVEAKVIPLVVESTFTNDTWFPLPVDQMKAAAVDTALTKISSTKKFAFLYKSEDKNIRPGSLNLAVTLVEPAESAKLTIKLNLPENGGSYVSSSSVSLRDKDHKQIFETLQKLGSAAADQLNLSASEIKSIDTSDVQSNKIYNEIMSLNINVIELHKSIGNSGAASHNMAINTRLGKLDTIISKLDEHHNYVKKNDELQNRKLDSIYSELQKLNIGTNTGNSPPDGKELSLFDVKLLPIVDTAIKLKYKKDFSGARNILSKVVKSREISKLFRSAVEEELLINLPLYEADTKKTELSFAFTDQVKGDKYQKTVDHIRSLYESVLKRPDVLFKKRIEIKQQLDSLMISADSMGAVAKMMRMNELNNLKVMLRVHMQRKMAMGSRGNDGFCPKDDELQKVIRKASMSVFTLNSIKESNNWCILLLDDGNNKSEQIKFNYEEAIIVDVNVVAATPLPPVKKTSGKRGRNIMAEQAIRNKVVLFSNAIAAYYKKNNMLPISISDLICRDPFKQMEEYNCASAQKDGIFYIKHEDDWVSIESYISDSEILKKCRATRFLEMFDPRYGECKDLDINSIPLSET